MTSAKDQHAVWRADLVNYMGQAHQDNASQEHAFFAALVAVLDGHGPLTFSAQNSYAPYLQRVLDGINQYDPSLEGQLLPSAVVQNLATGVVTVMTSHPDQVATWRADLQRFMGQAQQSNAPLDYAFFAALLGLLDGQQPSLPPDNPYAGVVQQIMIYVHEYHHGGGA